jgi:Protein of unknown function (DUF1488)
MLARMIKEMGRTAKGEREVYSVSLDPTLAEYVRALGEGNLSAGIAMLAKAYRSEAPAKATDRVQFADSQRTVTAAGNIEFWMLVDDQPRLFLVTDEAQRQHLGVATRTPGDRLRGFMANRELILRAVRQLVERDPAADTLYSDDFDRI